MALLVQSKSGTATTGTSITITLNSATTVGNCLAVSFGAYQGTTHPTVSGITIGGSADNYALAKQGGTTACDAEIWTDQNLQVSSTSVVITLTAGTGVDLTMAAMVEEWSGIAASSAVDTTNSGGASSTSWSSGSTGTLSAPNEVVLGMVYCANPLSTVTTPGSPWTELTQAVVTNTLTSKLATGYQIVSANTALTYSGTQSTGSAYAAVIVSLKDVLPPVPAPYMVGQSVKRAAVW